MLRKNKNIVSLIAIWLRRSHLIVARLIPKIKIEGTGSSYGEGVAVVKLRKALILYDTGILLLYCWLQTRGRLVHKAVL